MNQEKSSKDIEKNHRAMENRNIKMEDLMYKVDLVLLHLRKNNYRITNQRRLLIETILEDECSSCKEIYYKANKKDSAIGIATVYRMVKTLEDLGYINRKSLYTIESENIHKVNEQSITFVNESTNQTLELMKGEWYRSLLLTLQEHGVDDSGNISIVIKYKENQKEEYDDQLYHSCTCDNTGCKYHCKKYSAS